MSAYIDRLFDEYRRAAKTGQDVMDAAASENRDLSSDELTTRDNAFAAVSTLKAEIAKVQDFEKLRAAGDAFREVAAPILERATGQAPNDAQMFRAILQKGTGGLDMRGSDRIQNSREYPAVELRALQSAGGSAVETSFADFVTVYQRTFTPMLRPDVVRLLNRPDGSPLVLPRLTADPNHGGTVTAEAGGINKLDATVSSIQLNPYKYAVINEWSSELATDNTIGLENLIAFSTGRELSIDIGAHLTTGDDSGKPNGFITAATNGGTATGTGTTYGTYFGPTDLVRLFYGRAEPYRQVGSWQANSTSLAEIRNARATTGEHLWAPSLVAGAPETLLGRPIYENPAMANGSAAKSVAFGDFNQYVVVRVAPLRVETSIHAAWTTDQISLRTIDRVDGDLPDTAAIAYLVGAAV